MSREQKQRLLDMLADDVKAMLEYGLPVSLAFFILTYLVARWVL